MYIIQNKQTKLVRSFVYGYLST